MKLKKTFKKIIIRTKIRNTGTGLVTTIPQTVVQLLDLQTTNIIEWEIDPANNTINISIQDEK